MITACSKVEEITPVDKQVIFIPAEISHFHIEKYRHKKTPEHVPYILFKSYTEQFGFRGLYGTILIDTYGTEVKYLCLVNIMTTIDQARSLFSRMTPEPSPRDFGEEKAITPVLYGADEVYLYTDDMSYFHMVLRSSRIVYSIVLDGAKVEEPQVRYGLKRKLAYIQDNVNAIR